MLSINTIIYVNSVCLYTSAYNSLTPTITSLSLWVYNKLRMYMSSWSWQLSTLLIMQLSFTVYLLGLASMTQSFLTSKLFCHFQLYFFCSVSSSSNGSTKISPRSTIIHSKHYFSEFSYLWFISRSSPMYTHGTLSSPLSPLNSPPTLSTSKPQLMLSPSGCLPIFSHSISLKLNFFLSVFLLNSLKSILVPSNVIIKRTHSACSSFSS